MRWSSSAATTWATSSAATASISGCTSSRVPRPSPTRRMATCSASIPCRGRWPTKPRASATHPSRSARKRTRSGRAAVSSRSGGASSVPPPSGRRDPLGRSRTRAPHVDDRADRVVPPRRQGRRARGRHDAACLRGSVARIGRHRAVCHPHLQPDHRRRGDLPAPGRGRQRSLRLHRQGRRRQADRDRAPVRRPPWHREALLRDAGRRHLSLLLSRAGAGPARPVHPGRGLPLARVRRVWRRRHGRRVHHPRLRLVHRLHLLHDGEAAPRHVHGPAPRVGHRQGYRPRAVAAVGRPAVAGHVRGAGGSRSAAPHGVSEHDCQHDGRGRGAQRHLRARRDDLRRGIAPRA